MFWFRRREMSRFRWREMPGNVPVRFPRERAQSAIKCVWINVYLLTVCIVLITGLGCHYHRSSYRIAAFSAVAALGVVACLCRSSRPLRVGEARWRGRSDPHLLALLAIFIRPPPMRTPTTPLLLSAHSLPLSATKALVHLPTEHAEEATNQILLITTFSKANTDCVNK